MLGLGKGQEEEVLAGVEAKEPSPLELKEEVDELGREYHWEPLGGCCE